jgi:arsenate reductase
MMNKQKVLFLCSGNSCRSQMAEALLRKHAGERFQVYSAGMEPKEIHPMTRQVLAEIGLDMKGQCPKGLEEYLGKIMVSYLIVVCAKAGETCPTAWPGSPLMQMIFWPFDDPTVFEGTDIQKLEKFRQVRDQIEERIKTWIVELDQHSRRR